MFHPCSGQYPKLYSLLLFFAINYNKRQITWNVCEDAICLYLQYLTDYELTSGVTIVDDRTNKARAESSSVIIVLS